MNLEERVAQLEKIFAQEKQERLAADVQCQQRVEGSCQIALTIVYYH